jgi:hypothetical protein
MYLEERLKKNGTLGIGAAPQKSLVGGGKSPTFRLLRLVQANWDKKMITKGQPPGFLEQKFFLISELTSLFQ